MARNSLKEKSTHVLQFSLYLNLVPHKYLFLPPFWLREITTLCMSHCGINGMRTAGNMPGHFRILSQEKRIMIPYIHLRFLQWTRRFPEII
jgi:hypothetical protein